MNSNETGELVMDLGSSIRQMEETFEFFKAHHYFCIQRSSNDGGWDDVKYAPMLDDKLVMDLYHSYGDLSKHSIFPMRLIIVSKYDVPKDLR